MWYLLFLIFLIAKSKYLTDEELLDLINRDDLSEFEALSDDEGDDGWEDEKAENTEDENDDDVAKNQAETQAEVEIQDGNEIQVLEAEETDDIPVNNMVSANDANTNEVFRNFCTDHDLTEKSKVKWIKNAEYQTRTINWHTPNPPDAIDLQSPVDFFTKYISDNLFQEMAEMTNLYAVQKGIGRWTPTRLEEIKKFMGIHIVMGNLQFPRARMYWQSNIGIPLIKDAMPLNRFFKLRKTVHLVDVTQRGDNLDRLWKVRKIYDSIRNRCRELPLEQNLSIDEQIVPFKGQINIRQYIKNKPKKWGIKIYVLAGQSGQVYDFIIYQGATTEINQLYSKFGAGAATVMQLVERINDSHTHGLFFDNYFGSYNLFQYLNKKNIFSVGTIRVNRFGNPPLLSDKEMKKKERGSVDTTVSKDGIVITKWYDNKPVVVASNFIGKGNLDTCKRWDKKQKEYIYVPRPEAIKMYNANMGGVDKLDFLLSIYRSYVRSRKWTVRMITHAIDLALVCSWLEYRKQAEAIGVPKKRIVDLLSFRTSVAESLILTKAPPKRGRPSLEDPKPGVSKKTRETPPMLQTRYDGYNHFAKHDSKPDNTRCKYEECKFKTHIYCTKCNVHLCILSNRNCFFAYHNN